jgi:hypothetical protein
VTVAGQAPTADEERRELSPAAALDVPPATTRQRTTMLKSNPNKQGPKKRELEMGKRQEDKIESRLLKVRIQL